MKKFLQSLALVTLMVLIVLPSVVSAYAQMEIHEFDWNHGQYDHVKRDYSSDGIAYVGVQASGSGTGGYRIYLMRYRKWWLDQTIASSELLLHNETLNTTWSITPGRYYFRYWNQGDEQYIKKWIGDRTQ